MVLDGWMVVGGCGGSMRRPFEREHRRVLSRSEGTGCGCAMACEQHEWSSASARHERIERGAESGVKCGSETKSGTAGARRGGARIRWRGLIRKTQAPDRTLLRVRVRSGEMKRSERVGRVGGCAGSTGPNRRESDRIESERNGAKGQLWVWCGFGVGENARVKASDFGFEGKGTKR